MNVRAALVTAIVGSVPALAPRAAAAQEHIEHARIEHRQAAQPLDREVRSIAARGGTAWIAYRLPAVPDGRTACNAPVQLEPATEVIILARVSAGRVGQLRLVPPSCAIDAGDMPMIWLDGVAPDASAAWLSSIVTAAAATGDPDALLLSPAISALSVTPGPVALGALLAFAKSAARADVRRRALSALAFRAEAEAADTIQNAILNDPDTAVRKTAVGALARMPKDEGIPLLIEVARTSRNVEVRKQAMFWLGESNDPRAVSFFEEILAK